MKLSAPAEEEGQRAKEAAQQQQQQSKKKKKKKKKAGEEEEDEEEEEEDAATGLLKVLAIDEMCVSEDPLTGDRNAKARAHLRGGRRQGRHGGVDSLVQPAWPVVDMVTQVHGIKRERRPGSRSRCATLRPPCASSSLRTPSSSATPSATTSSGYSFVRSFVRLVGCSFVCLVALFLTMRIKFISFDYV